jgi:hypothetical protein
MVRPCGARGFVELADAVLHQCIRPPIGASRAPGHHGYQRACGLTSGQASNGPFGSPGFACAGKTDPPSRLILSQTSAGNGCCYVIDSSSLCTVPLFVPDGCSFVPACACRRVARKGPSRLAVALALALAPALPGHALTGPSTARGSSWSGRHRISLDALEGAPLVENRPGDAGQLVGKRNRQHVVVQSFLGGLNPRFEAIALPLL